MFVTDRKLFMRDIKLNFGRTENLALIMQKGIFLNLTFKKIQNK